MSREDGESIQVTTKAEQLKGGDSAFHCLSTAKGTSSVGTSAALEGQWKPNALFFSVHHRTSRFNRTCFIRTLAESRSDKKTLSGGEGIRFRLDQEEPGWEVSQL